MGTSKVYGALQKTSILKEGAVEESRSRKLRRTQQYDNHLEGGISLALTSCFENGCPHVLVWQVHRGRTLRVQQLYHNLKGTCKSLRKPHASLKLRGSRLPPDAPNTIP